MALTPAYAFPTPDPGDVPDVASDMQDLAEGVETELVRIDAAASSLADRVAALESGTGGVGWMPIGSGTGTGSSFSIDLTAGGKYPSPPAWDQVRVSMRVDLAAADIQVSCRINNDASFIYRSGSFTLDSVVPADSDADNWHFASGTASAWVIAKLATVSTNIIDLRIFHTSPAASLMAFQAFSSRQSDSNTTHRNTMASGALTTGLTATSLTFLAPTSTFNNAYWWAEGLRLVAP